MSCPVCSACPRCGGSPRASGVHVAGEPASWQVGTRRRPSKTLRPWKEYIGWAWRALYGSKKLSGPIRVDVLIRTVNPRKDLDNMVKAAVDGLKNVAMGDDTRVYCLVARKEPATDGNEGAEITLSPYHGPVFDAHLALGG